MGNQVTQVHTENGHQSILMDVSEVSKWIYKVPFK